MLLATAALVIICALLSCLVAYMIYQASQSQRSHKAQLLAIQKRLAEKQTNPNSPRPVDPTAPIRLTGTRNSQLDQIVGRIRRASNPPTEASTTTSKTRPSESTSIAAK